MSQIEAIKHQFHALIDQSDDELVLTHFYEAFASSAGTLDGSSWDGLSDQQKASVKQSYEESLQPDKLISNADVWGKYEKWLTK